jgi:preprotein translocase subunit SecA
MKNLIRSIANYFSPASITLRKAKSIVPFINAKEEEFSKLTHNEILAKTEMFKERIKKGESLDNLLIEAFALVREATKRVLYQRPYDVQLMGAYILHNRMIAEMYTGEGKTLVAVIAAYLNGLSGKGIQVVTVNDYLAKRDSEENGKILRYLGLTVGLVQEGLDSYQKQEQYNKDVTYVSNHEVAFDYLRDNMEMYPENQVMINRINFCIVDEVDSILLDEARTPLIISGPGDKSSELYKVLTPIVQKLDPKVHLEFDEFKSKAELTESGMDFIEQELCKIGLLKPLDNIVVDDTNNEPAHRIYSELYEPKNLLINHYINQIIRANFIMKSDIDYIVSKNGEIVIIDQNTGRLGFGRRFSDGLHQALEAKEQVEVKEESITLATTTYQSFFQLFQLAGMTGTAKEAEEEFIDVYNLEAVSVPTNRISKKIIHKDVLFFKNDARLERINEIVQEKYKKGQPVLIITLSVNDSEIISKSLNKKKITHTLLNAKNHEEEAAIIREAGNFQAVTVSTDIAGRGTDIQLGGSRSYIISQAQERNANEEEITQLVENLEKEKKKISDLGGLCVLCIGRHESERLDNQASGRCGRQGEPGEVFFLLSLEDELIQNTMTNSPFQQWSLAEMMDSNENFIEGYMVDTLIGTIQKSKSLLNYESRKNLYKYDKIIDIQRKMIYKIRNNILNAPVVNEDFNEISNILDKSPFFTMGQKIILNVLEKILFNIDYTSKDSINKAKDNIFKLFNLKDEIVVKDDSVITYDNILVINLAEKLVHFYVKKIEEKIQNKSTLEIGQFFKHQLITICDKTIQKYLEAISDTKDGSYLSSYAQKDPLNEFNKKMMGILSDFFLEWEKSFIEMVFYDKPMGKRKFGFESEPLKGTQMEDLFSLEEFEEMLKDKSFMKSMEHMGEINPDEVKKVLAEELGGEINLEEEQERIKIKNEINNLLMDHLKNSGSIEYVEEDNAEVLTYSPEDDINELINNVKKLSDSMTLDQLKELKHELLSKIHTLRDLYGKESNEYLNAVADGMGSQLINLETIMDDIEDISNDLNPDEWESLREFLIKTIKSMKKGKEITIQDEIHNEIITIIEDLEHLINNSNGKDWLSIKKSLLEELENWNDEE